MATYKPLQPNAGPTYGTIGDANLKLQQAINTTNPNAKLALDQMYGDKTKAAYDALIGQGYNYTNGAFTKPAPIVTPPAENIVYVDQQFANTHDMNNPYYKNYRVKETTSSNPVVSGTSTAADVATLGKDISSLTNTSADATKLLQDRMDALERRRAEEIAGIKASYEEANAAQTQRQTKDYAGRATGLVTSGGGFLGTTQSQQGVLQNLEATFQTEKNALMAKRDAAIREAENAYSDKQFDLAKLKIAEAKDTEKELYTRQKDMADQKLALAREARSQTEFDMGVTEKKVAAYAAMPDEEFVKLTPAQLAETDKAYYPGYTAKAREIEKATALGKTIQNDVKLKSDIQTLINKTPYGKKITIGGVNYVGMKSAGGGSTKGTISPSLAYQLGAPTLAGKKESDVILSLALENPPDWYYEVYKAQNPEVFGNLTKDQIKIDWKLFKEQPDISAYQNSAVVTKRIEGNNNPLSNLTASDIANAMQEVE